MKDLRSTLIKFKKLNLFHLLLAHLTILATIGISLWALFNSNKDTTLDQIFYCSIVFWSFFIIILFYFRVLPLITFNFESISDDKLNDVFENKLSKMITLANFALVGFLPISSVGVFGIITTELKNHKHILTITIISLIIFLLIFLYAIWRSNYFQREYKRLVGTPYIGL